MMGGFDGMMGGLGWPWVLASLLFWGGLLALVVWAVVRFLPGRRSEEHPESAEEILRVRFARGEIDADEYERSLEILRSEREALKSDV